MGARPGAGRRPCRSKRTTCEIPVQSVRSLNPGGCYAGGMKRPRIQGTGWGPVVELVPVLLGLVMLGLVAVLKRVVTGGW